MSSRALSLATVLLLIGFGAVDTALAQAQNLEAGKTPSQLFAQTCNACHKSPRGLLKTVAPGSLPGFLRQHYTTSPDMAGVLSSYLVSNGATDTRYQAKDAKDNSKGGKDGAKEKDKEKEANSSATQQQSPEQAGRRQRPGQEGAKPEGEGAAAGQKRMARPSEEGAKDGAKPAEGQATNERGPDGRKKKMSKRGKPDADEAPKADTAKTDAAKEAPATTEPSSADKKDEAKSEPKSEPKSESKSETAKVDGSGEKSSGDKSSGEKPAAQESKPENKPETGASQSAKTESAKTEPTKTESAKTESTSTEGQPDPVPQVTPAPPVAAKPAEAPSGSAAGLEPAPVKPQETPPAVTATAPPAPLAAPAGPPVPPISR